MLGHYCQSLCLLALTFVCTAGTVCAQDDAPASNGLPAVIHGKRAAKMVMPHASPEYPPVAKVNHLEGQVQLELTVDGEGKVDKAHVLDGNAILAESALRATRGWTFHPLTTRSGPAGFTAEVRLIFTLQDRGAGLRPRRPEQDFLRQVKPPQVVRPMEEAHPGDVVRMRLLVNDQGQVVDCVWAPGGEAQFESACGTLRRWTFRPAHWGNLPIASYLDVDVPVSASSVARATATNPKISYVSK
ncbi:MAG TPA: TonB family protein [Terriglobia bacterium]|nr:TonB family protein [Terriglobia bacterium]